MAAYSGYGSQYWNTMGIGTNSDIPVTTTRPPNTPTPAGTPTPKPTGGSSTPQKSAYDILADVFRGFGMTISPDLDAVIRQMLTGGYSAQDINLFMPDIEKTTAFQQRFPGFAQRISNGYNAIDIPSYLQLENQYHQIMQQAGLPKGFYDDPSDFGNWIANNVSPDEIQTRVQMATKAVQSIDPTTRNLLTRFYGLGTGDLASYFLDQKRALPVIERQYAAANVATWAQRAGFDVAGMSRYEDLVDKGVTADQAAQAYGTIGQLSSTVGKLAGLYGESYNQTDAENDVFFNQSDKRQRIVNAERATFGGSGRAANTGSSSRGAY
jgi:hypothetical protein